MLENYILYPIIKILTTDSAWSYKFAFRALIVFLVSLCLMLNHIGSPIINDMPWDVMVQLDGAWRIVNGQTPNVDFTNIIPPLTIEVTAFAMKVVSPSVSSIAYGNILLLMILSPWAWFIASSRMSAANALLFAVLVGILLVTPRALGGNIRATSYAMLYNRQGWVLLCMLFVEFFISYRKEEHSKELLGGLSSGILLAILLFCKLNFFGIAVIAGLIHILIFRPQKAWFVASATGFLLAFTAMYVFLHLNLLAYITEMKSIAPVYGRSRLRFIMPVVIDNIFYIWIIIVVLMMHIIKSPDKAEGNGSLWRLKVGVTGIFVLVSSILLCSTSSQKTDIPGFFMVGLICLEYSRRKYELNGCSLHSRIGTNYLYTILLLIPLFAGTIIIKDVGTIGLLAKWRHSELPFISESQRIQSKNLSDFAIPIGFGALLSDSCRYPAEEYPGKINDGLMLLRKHISSESRILALGFSNPFPLALGLPPPNGGVVNWLLKNTFNETYFPNADRVFKGANVVMIPKYEHQSDEPTVHAMKSLYSSYLNEHFVEKDSSQFWILFVMR